MEQAIPVHRFVILTLVWGWGVGPAFAVQAPSAPFLPILVRKAGADMGFAAALMPLAMVAPDGAVAELLPMRETR